MTQKRLTREQYNAAIASNPLWKYIHVEIEDEEGDDTPEEHYRRETAYMRQL